MALYEYLCGVLNVDTGTIPNITVRTFSDLSFEPSYYIHPVTPSSQLLKSIGLIFVIALCTLGLLGNA
jgi:hypothetical protein